MKKIVKMKKVIMLKTNQEEDNYGFSLVELLIAVAIIAAIFTPILRSFVTAQNVNTKAQLTQNATSIAEKALEDVKGHSIQALSESSCPFEVGTKTFCGLGGSLASPTEVNKSTFTDGSGRIKGLDYKGYVAGDTGAVWGYRINYDSVTATQGTLYDAVVDVTSHQYSVEGATDASDANVFELPKLKNVDSSQHAVLSWEINDYDEKAIEKLADENAKNSGDKTSIIGNIPSSASKETYITLKNDASGKTKVTCEITYSPGVSDKESLKYLVYNAYFTESKRIEADGTELNFGPNIYLFYTVTENNPKITAGNAIKNESIVVDNQTSGKINNVYLILQDGMDKLSTGAGTSLSLEVKGDDWTTVSKTSTSTITEGSYLLSAGADTKSGTYDDVKLYTNLKYNDGTEDISGQLFDKAAKDKIYYINVTVTKHGESDVLATLTSTMDAGKEADIH